MAITSAGLVLYAAGLFWTARRRPIPGAAAWAALVLDLGWVVGSVFAALQFVRQSAHPA